MPGNGWVKIHRQILDWGGFGDDAVFKLFIYCIARANRKRALVNGTWIEPGQFVFGERELADVLRWSRGKLRRKMILLEESGAVVFHKVLSVGTIAIIPNWEQYQNSTTDSTTNSTANSTSDDTAGGTVTRSKEPKEDKEEASASGFWGDKDEYV